MRAATIATLVTALALPTGCAAQRADVATVFADGNCQAVEVGVHRIDATTLARLRSTVLIGAPGATPELAPPALLIAIVPGEFPTAGYAVRLADAVVPASHELTIEIEIRRPPGDAVLAQMITRPCLVVEADDAALRRIRVIDAAGTWLGEIEVATRR